MNDLSRLYPVCIPPVLGLTNLLKSLETTEGLVERSMRGYVSDIAIHIIQIGAGGTGGYVAAEIMRFLGNMPEKLKDMFYYTLIDGDEFEPKNLSRQLCTVDDLGVNKAESLITNYGPYFGCNMDHLNIISEYLTDMGQLTGIKGGLPRYNNTNVTDYGTEEFPRTEIPNTTIGISRRVRDSSNRPQTTIIPIIIDCVDKTTPRNLIHNFLEHQYSNATLFDELRLAVATESIVDDVYKFMISKAKSLVAEKGNGSDLTIRTVIKNNRMVIEVVDNGNVVLCRTLGNIQVEVDAVRTQLPCIPATYVISSGNGQYTGQVYWGRYSRAIRNTKPITYTDVYGDRDVSVLFDVTATDKLEDTVIEVSNVTLEDASNMKSTAELFELSRPKPEQLQEIYQAYFAVKYAESLKVRSNSRLDMLGFDTAGSRLAPHMGAYDAVTGDIDESNVFNNSLERHISGYMSVPSPYKRSPELIDVELDKAEEQMSCAERAEQNIQNINANKTAATLVVNFFTAIINGLLPLEGGSAVPLTNAGISFDVRTNTMTPEPITIDYLRKYGEE